MEARILQIENHCTEPIRSLLKENILGTLGQSMVYQQLRTIDKLDHIPDAYFAQIKKGDQVISTCCFCKRSIGNETSFYVRYFSFRQSLRSTGHAIKRREKKSIIREEILGLLSGSGLNEEDALFYAYLDPKNIRSARLCYEFGFEEIRTFSTLTFSRFFPKSHLGCQKADKSDIPEIKGFLRTEYASHAFYTEENLFYEGNFFVKKNENGKIIAGIQANIEHWKIYELKGGVGKFLLTIISHLPLLNRLINHDFKFVVFDYCFGGARDIASLMETALTQHGLYSSLISIDLHSDMYQKIKAIDLGPLHRLKNEVRATVIAKHSLNNREKLTSLRQQPCFISTMDLT